MFWLSGINEMKLTSQSLFYLYWFSVLFKIHSISWCSICLFQAFKFIHFSSPISRSMLCLYYKITLSSELFLLFSNWCSLYTVIFPLLVCIIFVWRFLTYVITLKNWCLFYCWFLFLCFQFLSFSNIFVMPWILKFLLHVRTAS